MTQRKGTHRGLESGGSRVPSAAVQSRGMGPQGLEVMAPPSLPPLRPSLPAMTEFYSHVLESENSF